MTTSEKIASHVLYYLIFHLVFVNLGFFLGFSIQAWYLPVTYLLYIGAVLFINYRQNKKIHWSTPLLLLLVPILFIGVANLFGHTYDTSFDGQTHQQTGVISLANSWNPIWDKGIDIIAPVGQYGIEGEFGRLFTIGYPKSLWIIQASIYRLTGYINSGVITNLLASLLALVFVYNFLIRLRLSRLWSMVISIFAVLEPAFLRQIFTFMQDGFGYQISLISIVSLITFFIVEDSEKPLSLIIFLFSWLLLLGTKFSDLAICGVLGLICGGYVIFTGQLFNTSIRRIFKGVIILAIIILFAPYGINTIRYSAPLYPSNFQWAKDLFPINNIPKNLVHSNRITLFFYGIYSEAQVGTSSDNPLNIANLKIPFTFTSSEIGRIGAERVGTDGVLFSGLVTLSLVFIGALYWKRNKMSDRDFIILKTMVWSFVVIFVIGLIDPSPNVLRYTPQVILIPIITLLGLLLINQNKNFFWIRLSTYFLSLLILSNILLVIYPILQKRTQEMEVINSELSVMRESGLVYKVYAPSFYSNYTRLNEAGVRFMATADLHCKNEHILMFTYSTRYCP